MNDQNQQAKPANPLDVQQGGTHYKGKAIQPVEYISANNLNFLEGCIVKRITRWREKPGSDRFEDLRKIKHEIDLLIAMEERFNPEKPFNLDEFKRSVVGGPDEVRAVTRNV